jgi:membrane protease YdiL (CAAX protease family)
MEREFNPQPHTIADQTSLAAQVQSSSRVLRMALLLAAMIMPWFWVIFGLVILKDYRLTIIFYELLGCGLMVLLSRPKQITLFPLKLPLYRILLSAFMVNIIILGVFKGTNGFGMNWSAFYQHAHSTHLSVDGHFWFFTAYIVILNPLFEETFWRGTIYREWKYLVGPWPANLITSFFFGAWHWMVLQSYCEPMWALFLTFWVMVGGVIFAYLYERTGTLSAPVLLHGLGADLPMVFVVYNCIQTSSSFLK